MTAYIGVFGVGIFIGAWFWMEFSNHRLMSQAKDLQKAYDEMVDDLQARNKK